MLSAEMERLRTWSEAESTLPSEAFVNSMLIEMIQWHFHPSVVKVMLSKKSAIHLVTERNVLGPKCHAAPLVRERLALGHQAESSYPIKAKGPKLLPEEPMCVAEPVDFIKAASKPQAIHKRQRAGWILVPLAICGWATLLAGVTLVNGV